MAYRLEANESVSAGIKRITIERIDQALDDLTDPGKNRNKGVHDARKNFKRIRAALRLVRGEIGEERYRCENVCFRDAARLLSSARDSWVMVQTLDALSETYASQLPAGAFSGVREHLAARHKKISQQALEDERTVSQVVEAVRAARARIAALPIRQQGFTALRSGLQRVYRQGRLAMKEAYARPSAEAFHEWRKRVKYLWYQIEILAALWPNILDNLAAELHDLSEKIGLDHDLAVLRQTVLEDPAGLQHERELLTLVTLIDRRRLELEAQCRPLGERIYSDPPRRFTRRIASYWKAWRAEKPERIARLIGQLEQSAPPAAEAEKPFLTPAEMAVRLEIPVERVRTLIRAGKLPAEKVGTVWVIYTGKEATLLAGGGADSPARRGALLTPRQAGTRLGLAPRAVRALIHAGALPAIKAGRHWVIEAEQLHALRLASPPQ